MTLAQARWAAEHDWYICRTQKIDGHWVVTVRHESINERTKQFKNYRSLRRWAGY